MGHRARKEQRVTYQELRALRDRVKWYAVIGEPMSEQDVEQLDIALTAYLNLRGVHASTSLHAPYTQQSVETCQ